MAVVCLVRDGLLEDVIRWRGLRLFEADLRDGLVVEFAGSEVWITNEIIIQGRRADSSRISNFFTRADLASGGWTRQRCIWMVEGHELKR